MRQMSVIIFYAHIVLLNQRHCLHECKNKQIFKVHKLAQISRKYGVNPIMSHWELTYPYNFT